VTHHHGAPDSQRRIFKHAGCDGLALCLASWKTGLGEKEIDGIDGDGEEVV
jgi:hypothetical protein